MSIFMKSTIKVKAHQAGEFLEVLKTYLVPLMEDQGWRLHGCFAQRFGSIQPAVFTDIWEMEDMDHVERVLHNFGYRTDERYQKALPVLKSAVLEEALEFMELKMGRLEKFYPERG